MFEIAELGRHTDKDVYKKAVPLLRQELLDLQRELHALDHSQVIILFAGVDGAGKGHTINLLNEWMDSRWLITRAFDEPADVETERPEFWRYWLALPPRGRIALFMGSWYHSALLDKVYGQIDEAQLDRRLDRIHAFENALADDGATIIKFWMHLSREAQERRLKQLKKDPFLRVRVREQDWEHWKMYDSFIEAAERTIMRTNAGKAPWHIIEGADPNYRSLAVGETVRDTLRKRMELLRAKKRLTDELKNDAAAIQPTTCADSDSDSDEAAANSGSSTGEVVTMLTRLDCSKTISKASYSRELKKWQSKLYSLQLEAHERRISSILVFEGPDAAGKGGAIRRITAALDARNYQVHAVAAPSDEERAQHYLWRFWRLLERAGRVTIFDRSWYGRVLVERVEGYASESEWRRAFAEINDFEEQLADHGILLVKYWVHITAEEQLARFEARQQTPHKRWKITDEDWRNRARRLDYELAAHDMFQYTSTSAAPWQLVEGNDKRYARIKTLKTLCERLKQRLHTETQSRSSAH
jgi:polyphosphate:AMP phosphotransferase